MLRRHLLWARCYLVVLAGIFLTPCLGLAESQVLLVEATSFLREAETPAIAEARLLQQVRQIAVERAAADLETSPIIRSLKLSSDQVQIIVGGVLKVKVLEKTRMATMHGWRLLVKIKALLETDGIDALTERVKATHIVAMYMQLQELYRHLHREIENWHTTYGRRHSDATLDQLHEWEQLFMATQMREQSFFAGLLSGTLQ